MLFGIGKTEPKAGKKAAKKVVKKVAKKVAKKAAKKATGTSFTPSGPNPAAEVGKFFSEENWIYQAVTMLADLPKKK